jgi:flagellin
MPLVLRTNRAAAIAMRSVGSAARQVGNQTKKLATGERLNSAADGAAALGVATHLRAHATSGRQAIRNANDGMSIVSTAEGAADEVVNLLTRLRSLAVEAASGTLNNVERQYADDEVEELRREIRRLALDTVFNDVHLTDGSVTQMSVQVGVNNDASSRIDIELPDLGTTALSISGVTVDTIGNARSSIPRIDRALDRINGFRSEFGASINRLESSIKTMEETVEATTSAESKIRDADFAVETAELTAQQILQQSATSVLSQAKSMNEAAIRLISE